MAYQIQYGRPTKKERIARVRNSKAKKSAIYIILGVSALTVALLGKAGFMDFLIPGDQKVTKHAFYSMINQVQQGEHITSAITAFCEEILINADVKN